MIRMGDVWDRATEFLSDNLSVILPIAVLAIFVPASIQANIAPLAAQSAMAKLLVNALSLVFSIVSLWGQLAIVALAIDPAAGRAAATRTASGRLLPMIGIALLLLIGLVVLIMPIPIALGLSGYDLQGAMDGRQVDMPPGAARFTAIYGLVLLPVLLFFAARLALVGAIVVGERRGAGVVRRSFALTRGVAWKIIGVTILFGIVAIVAVLAAKTVFGSILQLIAGGQGDISVATVLTAILVGAVTTGFTVLATAFTAKLYVAAHAAHADADAGIAPSA